jgi:phosphatidylserine/phosphatidylglycerophosphate/cardiolipin synthase-like enzyme
VQAYILTSDKIITAIINAHNRPGVQVQILLNGRQKRSQRLQQSKVPIRLDKKHTEAHNKVMIIDGHTVITGSFNFTEEAERENAENLLVIKDTLLAKQYAENWHHHWEHFDDEKLNVTPLKRNLVLRPRLARFEEYFKAHVRPKLIQYFEEHPQLIENFQPGIEAHFSPGDSPTAAIVHELDQARESVLVQAFILTSDEIIEAIINAHNRPGVQVEILLDVKKAREQNSKQNLKLCRLCESKSGSKLRPWVDNEHESGAAHNKVIIIDNCIVITGSFNFTITAETQNAENLLIIRDPALAKQYTENYYFHLAHSPYLWFPEWTPPHQGW